MSLSCLFLVSVFPDLIQFELKEDDCCQQPAALPSKAALLFQIDCDQRASKKDCRLSDWVVNSTVLLCNGVHRLVFCLLNIFTTGSVGSKNLAKIRYLSDFSRIFQLCDGKLVLC